MPDQDAPSGLPDESDLEVPRAGAEPSAVGTNRGARPTLRQRIAEGDFWQYQDRLDRQWRRDSWVWIRKNFVVEFLLAVTGAIGAAVTAYTLLDAAQAREVAIAAVIGAAVTVAATLLLVGLYYALITPHRVWARGRDASEDAIKGLNRLVAAKDQAITDLAAQLFTKLGSDEPITPPSVTFQTIGFLTAYLPPIKTYKFSLLDSAKGLVLRALCEGWPGELAINVASSTGGFRIEPLRRSENTFTFRIPETLGSEAVLSVNFQTAGTVKIRELEEQEIEIASLKDSPAAAIVPSGEILRALPNEIFAVTMPEPSPGTNYLNVHVSESAGTTMVILNLDDIVIKNYGEQPVLVEGIEVCVLQDNSDVEVPSRTFEHSVSSRTTSARLEAQDVAEFSVFHRIRVDEKIPADRWMERVRLRVEATRIGVKYYRFGEAFFR
ncbi:MAG TPA: hypothetical protein VNJ70_00905 [Thermoanaerobaculia bacterium]|nr:hypothetical protein [Thermoanaerobaculia bacterium]